MAAKLYVGNLPFHAAEDDVLELFKQAGDVVRCSIIIDRATNRSQGFAFVEMGSQEEAPKAISQINGRALDGRTLTVNEARPRSDRLAHDFKRNNG
jgi:cold-inducible RNA-binding protein